MRRISRSRRAEIARRAHEVRLAGQREGWTPRRIAAAIVEALPDVLPLEAWRLAYGWSRPQAIMGIAASYTSAGLAPPPINPSMLCRWEHGSVPVSEEYAETLAHLYQATPTELGLRRRVFTAPATATTASAAPAKRGGSAIEEAAHHVAALAVLPSGYPLPHLRERSGHTRTLGVMAMVQSGDGDSGRMLVAVRQSVRLALEVEGPAGGPHTRAQLDAALAYYDAHYARHPPAVLAQEVIRCRTLVSGLLDQPQGDQARRELRRTAGWLSALLGNLAFHAGDSHAADIHLSTATHLGNTAGDGFLTCWSLGARAMVAHDQHRPADALNLARQGLDHAGTPLRRAQIHAWAELRAHSALGDTRAARQAMADAQREFDTDPDGEQPGRFGFDAAELTLHLAEAHLSLGQAAQARTIAEASQARTSTGRPGWAAATLVLAQAEATARRPDTAAELAHHVLDTVPAPALRATARARLGRLLRQLSDLPSAGSAARDLGERLRTLPAITPPPAPHD